VGPEGDGRLIADERHPRFARTLRDAISAHRRSGKVPAVDRGLTRSFPIVMSCAEISAEIWARDPANADGFLLSDGLRFTVCP
jgi:hypothetical protein